jgi:putative membrane protein
MNQAPRTVHPAVMLLRSLYLSVRVFLFLFIAWIIQGAEPLERMPWFFPYLLSALLILLLLYSWLNWRSFTYLINSEQITVNQGIIFRRSQTVNRNQVSNLHQNIPLGARLFGLVELAIETEGSEAGELSIKLRYITKKEAERIRTILVSKDSLSKEQTDSSSSLVRSARITELLLGSMTSYASIAVFGSLLFAYSQISQRVLERIHIPTLSEWTHWPPYAQVISLVFVFLVSWLFSIIRQMLKYYRFTVSRYEDRMHISYGLLTKRKLEIQATNVKAVRIEQNWLRQPLGYATLYIEGSESSIGNENVVMLFFPFLKVSELDRFFDTFLPEMKPLPLTHFVPSRARIRYWLRLLLPCSVTAIILSVFVPYGWISLVLIAWAGILAELQYRSAGWTISDKQIAFRYRAFDEHYVLMPQRHIRAFEQSQSFFQIRRHLASLKVHMLSNTTSKSFGVRDLDATVCNELFHSLRRKPPTLERSQTEESTDVINNP